MHDYIKIEINKEFTDTKEILQFLDFIKELLKEDKEDEEK